MTDRLVRRNGNKPHRCPSCHAVVTSETRWWRTYSCRDCNVWWFGGIRRRRAFRI